MNKIFKIIVIIFAVIFTIYVALVLVGWYRAVQRDKTIVALGKINARSITMDDVMGKNLPPKPDQAQNDATIAGIDANNNAIRDDVELAIFEKYPNSAKTRSAMLQYAQALQLELTEVFNSETLVKVIQKQGLSYRCLNQANKEDVDNYEKDIDNLVLNTELRRNFQSSNLDNYMTTYSLLNSEACDIDIKLLPN